MFTFNEEYFEPTAGDFPSMLGPDYSAAHTVFRSIAISLKRLADAAEAFAPLAANSGAGHFDEQGAA